MEGENVDRRYPPELKVSRYRRMEWGDSGRPGRPKGYVTDRRYLGFVDTAAVLEAPLSLESCPTPRFGRTLLLDSLHSKELVLRHPLPVYVEQDDNGEFVAYAPDLNVYGIGGTEFGALSDLRAEVVELYMDLREANLGSAMSTVFDYLRSVVVDNAS